MISPGSSREALRLQGGSGIDDADVAAALSNAVQQVFAIIGLPGSK